MIKQPKRYTIKYIDEYGECFQEYNHLRYNDKNRAVKEWLKDTGDHYIRAECGEITQLIKFSGEELWYYEEYVQK